MLELVTYNEEVLDTRDRITIDLIKDGEEFLRQFEINEELLVDTVSVIYKYLQKSGKIPQNLFKYYIASYYIISRHPKAFPLHESKKEFCEQFGLKVSSLEYCVEKITSTLGIIKIMDNMNYPYFLDPKRDISFKYMNNIIQSEVDSAMMNFLLNHQVINSQILSEKIINRLIFELDLFPEELFRQFFVLIQGLIEGSLKTYREYVNLQKQYFI